MRAVLEVRDLQVELLTAHGVVRAVDGVSFTVQRGETVALIGESGSGKTTTAMAILRLLADDLAVLSGRVTVAGHDVLTSRTAIDSLRGRTVVLVPQDPMTALNPIRTIGRQMIEAIRIGRPEASRDDAIKQAVELLANVHIRDPESTMAAYPHELSGGMLQRALIAMAVASEPQLIVADEPTSALDVTVQAGILDLLLELQESTGVAILLITHDLGVARLMSDRIHVMRAGRFVESGDAEQIVENPREPYTKDLLAAIPVLGPWTETASDAAPDATSELALDAIVPAGEAPA